MEENRMILTDDEGSKQEMEIIFTLEPDNSDNKYVLFTSLDDEDENVYAARYTDDGELDMDLSDEELAMCEEALGAFSEEDE